MSSSVSRKAWRREAARRRRAGMFWRWIARGDLPLPCPFRKVLRKSQTIEPQSRCRTTHFLLQNNTLFLRIIPPVRAIIWSDVIISLQHLCPQGSTRSAWSKASAGEPVLRSSSPRHCGISYHSPPREPAKSKGASILRCSTSSSWPAVDHNPVSSQWDSLC